MLGNGSMVDPAALVARQGSESIPTSDSRRFDLQRPKEVLIRWTITFLAFAD
jgi:hypothetical protein